MTHSKGYLILLVFSITAAATVLAAAPTTKRQPAATSRAVTSASSASDVKPATSGEAVQLNQSSTQKLPDAVPAFPAKAASAPAGNYTIGWSSINSGGTISASSPSYQTGISVGQSVAGAASSPNYQAGVGFWYGAGGCDCPLQGDVETVSGPGVVDVFDVIQEIGIAFSGGTDITDAGCPASRGDVNNDGVVDVFDVIDEIGIAFSGGSPVNPCAP